MDQLELAISAIADIKYSIKPSEHQSFGKHVRHCLNHIDALLYGVQHGAMNYDIRERDASLEEDRSLALKKLIQARRDWRSMAAVNLNQPIRLKTLVCSESGQWEHVESTLGRELHYVSMHTLHHLAMMKMIALRLQQPMPQNLGVANSTLYFEQQQPQN